MQSFFNLGLDIGSTTLKIVVTNENDEICFSDYRRHNAAVSEVLTSVFENFISKFGDSEVRMLVTGSVGMGLTERYHFPFMQEVVASALVIDKKYQGISTLIDIGGEDSKLIFFNKGKAPIMRMNGSCAGGTGAFIDQMATMLHVSVDELSELAEESKNTFAISSRCGVFAKTDIQNLISRNVSMPDIAASVFHAIAVQIVTTLARACDINAKILFCGGPFAFIPYLRKAFIEVLNIKEDDYIIPENANLIAALGCAIDKESARYTAKMSEVISIIQANNDKEIIIEDSILPALFTSNEEFINWKEKKQKNFVSRKTFAELENTNCYLGVDSGSTTTKIVLTDEDENLVYSFYSKNKANPLDTLQEGLRECNKKALEQNKNILIVGSCVTGYGEDLIKAAFNLDFGIVETIAHYTGALKFNPNVSFILDIGGQDMKAIFVENGVINRLEINEACSSGCGSFIEGFAENLKYSVSDFAELACTSTQPCDLGTRCTVFMNSKVKQFLRLNAQASDIAAGLSYSIIKNMLHKVLKIHNYDDLGKYITVQGGTFKNYSVIRAMEHITNRDVSFTDIPELTGAYGAALYAKRQSEKESTSIISLNLLASQTIVV